MTGFAGAALPPSRRPVPPRGTTAVAAITRTCPLQRAAARIGDPEVTAAVARYHPAWCCPARRRSTP
jgi:hypothetical protein